MEAQKSDQILRDLSTLVYRYRRVGERRSDADRRRGGRRVPNSPRHLLAKVVPFLFERRSPTPIDGRRMPDYTWKGDGREPNEFWSGRRHRRSALNGSISWDDRRVNKERHPLLIPGIEPLHACAVFVGEDDPLP